MEVLRLGMRGPLVQMLQLALARAGYYSGEIDGIFGYQTQRAVFSFQSAFGVTSDGVVGPATWGHILPYIRGYFYRVIRSGDTLWSLARQYGTTVRAILTANPTLDPDSLRPGQTIVIPFGFPAVPTNIDYTSTLTTLIIDGLKARYPFLRTGNFGRSVMGKSLHYISIGTGATQVFYNAAHHANEWITTPVLLKYVEDYARAYSENGSIFGTRAADLYRGTTLYVAPLVNPDGVDLVTGAINRGTFYENAVRISSDYPNIPFPSGWKANIAGTDLNLYYPAEWERAREQKFAAGFVSPAPRDYVGSAPLSAPESAAVYNFTLNHDFALILAYHTQGEIIYWKFMDYDPPRAREIGERMSQASGYPLEITPEYSGYAGYKDWFIQEFNRPGYTVEVGLGESPLPLSQFDKIYNDNIGILTIGMSSFI